MGTCVRAATIAGALLTIVMAGPVAAQPPEIRSVVTNYETETMEIKGLRFGTLPSVQIAGNPITVLTALAQQIVVQLPPGLVQAAGSYLLTVTRAKSASGSIAVTVVQKPFQFGYLASKWMHELATQPEATLAKLPGNRSLDTGVEVITRANVAEFKAKLAEMKAVQ